MNIKFFDDGIIKKFRDLLKNNASEQEICLCYKEICQRGLSENDDVKGALRMYREQALTEPYVFILEQFKRVREIGSDKANQLGYNRAIITALFEYMELGGLPDKKICEIANSYELDLNSSPDNRIWKFAKNFNMDIGQEPEKRIWNDEKKDSEVLNQIATEIISQGDLDTDYNNIGDIICETVGLNSLVKQATSAIKGVIPNYDDLDTVDHISTTLLFNNGSNAESEYYRVECGFDSNGQCQSLSIRSEDNEYPITINNVQDIPHLAFSKKEVIEKARRSQEDER